MATLLDAVLGQDHIPTATNQKFLPISVDVSRPAIIDVQYVESEQLPHEYWTTS